MKTIKVWKKVFENDLESVAFELKEVLAKPAVIILSGEVGAGKTTFTRSFIGRDIDISSPTYSLINESGPIVHADFYRLKSEDEIIHLELPLYLEGKSYFLVEWGRAYLNQIKRFLDEDFRIFDLEIIINESGQSRDFILKEHID